jgi:S1-C subfamily serine protease
MRQPQLTARRRGAIVVTLLIVGVSIGACSSDNGDSAGRSGLAGANASGGDLAVTSLQEGFESVVQRVRPSVVEISTDGGLGSGVVYDTRGNIVTNAHVVGDATRFSVTLVDGKTMTATLVGSYPPDDVAVIKVQGDTTLSPAEFADSANVHIGQITLAIGNPLGLASSVTDGIVSSTGRTVSEGGGVVLPSTIQTSAPINPGNSGGALVGLDAKVIGIPTLAAVVPELGGAAPGIGFAIPINRARFIADQLISSGRVTNSGRAALGVSGATVTSMSGQPVGVLVRSLTPDGAAAAAGINVGDVVTAVNGKPTPTLDALGTILADLKPGDTASVEVLRPDGSRQTVRVTLGSL